MQTRRHFLAASAALPFAYRALARAQHPAPRWLLLGTGTEKGILRSAWNPATGRLGAFDVAATTDHPTYLALHPQLPVLYAANETPKGDGTLSSFRLDRATASLSPLESLSTGGNSPCYLSVDHAGNAAFTANYGGGSVTSFRLNSAGRPAAQPAVFNCNRNPTCGTLGPQVNRQDAPHMHCAVVSPRGDFLLACNLGEDAIEIFPISAPNAAAPLGVPQRIATRPGSGPRHIAFHPNGRWFYVIHELDCTLQLFNWTVAGGTATVTPAENSIASTLPPGVSPDATSATPKTACELLVSADGRYLYANTRGADTLAVYSIHPGSGALTEQQRIATGGTVTRHIALDPSHRWLLCANQGSSTITVFAHDPKIGYLNPKPTTYAVDVPMFLQFV